VVNAALEKFDAAMRRMIIRRQLELDDELAGEAVRFIGEKLLAQIDSHSGWSKRWMAQSGKRS